MLKAPCPQPSVICVAVQGGALSCEGALYKCRGQADCAGLPICLGAATEMPQTREGVDIEKRVLLPNSSCRDNLPPPWTRSTSGVAIRFALTEGAPTPAVRRWRAIFGLL